jgi:hypothetical protein
MGCNGVWTSFPDSRSETTMLFLLRRQGCRRSGEAASSLSGGLKARDITAWAGASVASGGPGNRCPKIPPRPERPKQNTGIISTRCPALSARRGFSLRTLTWGFARCASPQAVISRAFSPENVQTPGTGGTPVPLRWKRRDRGNFVCLSMCRACEWLNTYSASAGGVPRQ